LIRIFYPIKNIQKKSVLLAHSIYWYRRSELLARYNNLNSNARSRLNHHTYLLAAACSAALPPVCVIAGQGVTHLPVPAALSS
jgi:hypothetical protein